MSEFTVDPKSALTINFTNISFEYLRAPQGPTELVRPSVLIGSDGGVSDLQYELQYKTK